MPLIIVDDFYPIIITMNWLTISYPNYPIILLIAKILLSYYSPILLLINTLIYPINPYY